ncbi:MAG: serine hydrolase [Parvularculaceae bacterium]
MNRRTLILGAAAFIALALAGAAYVISPMARVAAAYKAKALCSEIFLAGRDPVAVAAHELAGIDPAVDAATARIDEKKRRVNVSLFGLGPARSSYREGYGCTIESGGAPASLPAPREPVAAEPWQEAPPVPGLAIARVDYGAVEYALNEAITDEKAGHRAFLLAVDGKIVAERYAPGFDETTPFLSWSMAKSVTASLVGAAALKGYVKIDEAAPVREWKGDAERAAITWNDLLRMQSGLEFDETYGDPKSDVSEMLFRAREAGAVAARQPLIHAPGEHWSYSSGTTNLIMRTLREVLAEKGVDLYAFAREALFKPIGAASFILEPDSSGAPIGSSYIYATARDWARLGELYLEGGAWNGERILPEGWTDYARAPTPASDGEYGAHFWLNRDGANGRKRFVPGLPDDVYYMAGHEGQYVFIVPDKSMVIVRLGQTRGAVPIEIAGPVAAQLYAAVGEPSGGGAP